MVLTNSYKIVVFNQEDFSTAKSITFGINCQKGDGLNGMLRSPNDTFLLT